VKRRLELLGTWGGVRLYDDFAHHPTAIERTLAAVRRQLAPKRVLVVTEPRSNTMKLGTHRESLVAALGGADASYLLQPEGLHWNLADALAGLPSARIFADTAAIVAAVAQDCRAGDVVVIMSNGGFGSMHRDLPAALAARACAA
jgi:UDP-N-acetylmuramate: L-alanyl-gamma-D-glutamyl-meso-diaminopimelate ligase